VASRYIARSKAASTIQAYRSDWRSFTAWCEGTAVTALPATPQTIACYIAEMAETGSRVSTIARRLAAIAKAHSAAGFESPCAMRHAVLAETLHGIKRVHGTAQAAKAPLLTSHIRRLVSALPSGLIGSRDHAMLLIGFAGGFRRSELVALTVQDVEFADEGLMVRLRRSTTDQEGSGRLVGIAHMVRTRRRALCAP
jgi:site-specific recombinase XerD